MKKKILSFSIAGLLIAVLITTIVTALVKSTFYYPIENAAVKNVMVLKNGQVVGNYRLTTDGDGNFANEEHAEIINEILRLNKKGYEETVLASVFLGHYSHETTVQYKHHAVDVRGAAAYTIVLEFSHYSPQNAQTLMLHGEKYKVPNTDEDVKYQKMIFEVNNTDTMEDVTIYLEATSNLIKSIDDKDFTVIDTQYQIKTLAKQDKLYKYLDYLFA